MRKTTKLFTIFCAILFICTTQLLSHSAEQPVSFSAAPFIATSLDGAIIIPLTVTPDAEYHFYSKEKGETGKPTSISLTPSMKGNTVRYPAGVKSPDPILKDKMTFLYKGEETFFITLPNDAAQRTTLDISILLCSDSHCLPINQSIVVDWNGKNLPKAEAQTWWKTYNSITPRPPDAVKATSTSGIDESKKLASKLGVQLPGSVGTANGITSRFQSSKNDLPLTTKLPQLSKNSDSLDYNFAPRYYLQSLEVSTLWKAIVFGLIAGFILNFMPCVLPVISLKLSSLVAATQITDEAQRTKMFREHNIFFALGILTWFGLLTIILTSFELAWGQLFQNEPILIGLTLIIFVLALSIFDVFPLPMFSLSGRGTGNGNDKWGAYSTGLLATLLATPCSGPFLGGVLGWAFLQPIYVLVLIFLSVGVGMAMPYIIMAFIPELVNRFPKPGAWTSTLAHIVGFFLLGTVVYLLYILPANTLPNMLILLWITALGAWAWGRFSGLQFSTIRNLLIRTICIAGVVASAIWLLQTPPEIKEWQNFTPVSFNQQIGQQRLIVDFSADWCPNCKVLEQTVLTPENRARWETEYNVTFIKVDMTKDDDMKQRFLESMGSSSIPIVAIFPKGEDSTKPVVLRDLFTSGQFEKAMKKAFIQ